MPIYKRCSKCGKRVPEGSRCPCNKQRHQMYDKYYRDRKSKDYYSGSEWKVARTAALETDEGIDVFVFMTTGEVIAADTVHHIIPLKEDWEQRNNIDNLMSVRHDTHSIIEKEYKKDKRGMQKKLREMLNEYRKQEGRGGLKSFE